MGTGVSSHEVTAAEKGRLKLVSVRVYGFCETMGYRMHSDWIFQMAYVDSIQSSKTLIT